MNRTFSTEHHLRFAMLTEIEKRERIHALAAQGWGDHAIAGLFGLHVRIVREVLGERQDARREA